jgi:tetratricopeptide (TPR) repeat protein
VEYRLSLSKPLARWLLITVIMFSCLWLVQIITTQFIIGVFSDPRTTLTKAEIQTAAAYYPNSSTLQALLAQAEMTEVADHEGTATRAAEALKRAIYLSPRRYDLWLLKASAMELKGDRSASEGALLEALKLAPNNVEVHWRMANLLLRENRFEASLPHFRVAVTANPTLLQSVHNLLWDLSGGKIEALEAATGSKQESRIELAHFLLRQSRVAEAARVFAQVEREVKLRSSEAAAFLNALIPLGEVELARKLWAELVTGKRENNWALIWNGEFESSLVANFPQFDWMIRNSKYAAISIDPSLGRNSSHSLRIDFAGLDTTTLNDEFRQLLLLRPGARYRLEYFVRAKNLATPEGPRITIASSALNSPVAVSPAVPAGTYDWQPVIVEFTAPPQVKLVEIRLQRTPKFSYDEPTSGTFWLDDINLTELEAKK